MSDEKKPLDNAVSAAQEETTMKSQFESQGINWDKLLALLPYLLPIIGAITGKPITFPGLGIQRRPIFNRALLPYLQWFRQHNAELIGLLELPAKFQAATGPGDYVRVGIWTLQTIEPAADDFPLEQLDSFSQQGGFEGKSNPHQLSEDDPVQQAARRGYEGK